MKENSKSSLSTNKEAISNATKNFMKSSILTYDGMPYTCRSDRNSYFIIKNVMNLKKMLVTFVNIGD